ncbi:MAG: MerR family transcriptional regulator [Atopobiaceae bacterium]|nr:MerR family transcriptional regulator [Atopobiaceae bacterium]
MRYTQKNLCRAFDIKRDTLHHYERLGIIHPQIDAGNGYRYYDDWQINLLWECKRY